MKFPLQSLYELYRSGIRNGKYRWWIILGTLVYLLSPLDISPDIFPIVGEIDDVLLVTLMLSEVSQLLVERLRNPAPQTQPAQGPSPAAGGAATVDVDAVSMD